MDFRNPAETLPIAGADRGGWRFDGFALDARRGELLGRDGAAIALRPKTELLLRRFLAEPGRLLGREELMSTLWPAAVVTDDSLVQCVGELRAALDDRTQRLISTVPRRGYRFEATVVPIDDSADAAEPSPGPAPLAPEAAPSPVEASTRDRARLWTTAALVAAVALGGVAATRWHSAMPSRGIDEEVTSRHVIAVMPFSATAGDAHLRGTADEIADEIAAQIGKWPGTRAIGRGRTAGFDGGLPLAGMAESLHANYVVTGQVTRPLAGGDGLSIDVQLHAVADGAVIGDRHLDVDAGWGDSWSADIGQLTMNLARGRIGDVDDAKANRPGHEPDAADLALLGWSDVMHRRGGADVERARERFERALRQDPDSTIALGGLAAACLQTRSPGAPVAAADLAAAKQTIDRLLMLAPNDANASLLWGSVQMLDGNAELALAAFDRVVRLSPSFANGHLMRAQALLAVGRTEEVRAEAERAARLASLSRDASRASAAFVVAAEADLMLDDDARAATLARRAVAEQPNSGVAHGLLASLDALAGRQEEARAEMAIYRRISPDATVAAYANMRHSTHPVFVRQRARLYEGLRLAGLPEG